MDSNNRSELLKKYWRGETSVKEEQILKESLSDSLYEELPEAEERYFKQVGGFSQLSMKKELKVEQFIKNERQEASPSSNFKISANNRFRLLSVAASFLLLLSAIGGLDYWNAQKQQEQLAARAAFNEARQSLLLMSSKLNKGTTTTSYHFNKFTVAQQKIKGKGK